MTRTSTKPARCTPRRILSPSFQLLAVTALLAATLVAPLAQARESASCGAPAGEREQRGRDSRAGMIDCLLRDETALHGVMLIDPDGEVIYRRNGDVPFVAASLYKLVLMVDILSQIEAGLLSNDTPLLIEARFVRPENGVDSRYDASWIGRTIPVDDALLATGAYSSNVAAEALLTRTTRARLQRVAVSLGLHTTWMAVNPANVLHEPSLAPADSSPGAYRRAVTFIDRFAYDGRVHITAPADIATFYRRLLEGTVVNRKVSASIMNILAQQVVNDRIPALLPPETHTVHKTGNLQGVVHDAGIIYTSDGPLILVVMAQDAADGAHVAEIQRQLAAVAFGDG